MAGFLQEVVRLIKYRTMKHKKQDNAQADDEQVLSGQAEGQKTGGEQAPVSEQPDMETELAKHKDAYLRLYAEFDNYKKRSARERVEWIKMASSEVLESLLPVLDDFERGIAEANKHSKEEDVKGFELIYSKLMGVLKQKGLSQMEVNKGDDFDVDMHDAIARIPSEDEKLKGKIVDVTQKGYKLGDRVIRYAKVVVGA